MAQSYSALIRRAMLDQITANAGSNALLKIYDGTKPATGGAVTNLLATFTMGATFAPAAVGSTDGQPVTLTVNLPAGVTATGQGIASWYRITKADGTFVVDGTVGTSAADLIVSSTTFSIGQPLTISSFVITEGNP